MPWEVHVGVVSTNFSNCSWPVLVSFFNWFKNYLGIFSFFQYRKLKVVSYSIVVHIQGKDIWQCRRKVTLIETVWGNCQINVEFVLFMLSSFRTYWIFHFKSFFGWFYFEILVWRCPARFWLLWWFLWHCIVSLCLILKQWLNGKNKP